MSEDIMMTLDDVLALRVGRPAASRYHITSRFRFVDGRWVLTQTYAKRLS